MSDVKVKRPRVVLVAYIVAFAEGALWLFLFSLAGSFIDNDCSLQWCGIISVMIGLAQLMFGCHLYIGHRRAKVLGVVVLALCALYGFVAPTKIAATVFAAINAVPFVLCFCGSTHEWLSQYPSQTQNSWTAFVEKLKRLSWMLKVAWVLIGILIALFIFQEDTSGWLVFIEDDGYREYLIYYDATYVKKGMKICVDIRNASCLILENRKRKDWSRYDDDFDEVGRFNLLTTEGRNGCKKMMHHKLREKPFRQLSKVIDELKFESEAIPGSGANDGEMEWPKKRSDGVIDKKPVRPKSRPDGFDGMDSIWATRRTS